MALRKWGFIFLGPGFDPRVHSLTVDSGECQVRLVGLDFRSKEQVVEVAKELVRDGAQLIELCGGFGPRWITKVSDAVGDRIPVGGVAYGPEFRAPILALLEGTKGYASPPGVSFSSEKSG